MNEQDADVLLALMKSAKNGTVQPEAIYKSLFGEGKENRERMKSAIQLLLIDKYALALKNSPGQYRLTKEGREFPGYEESASAKKVASEQEKELDELKRINLLLSNERMEYEKKIRKLQKAATIGGLFRNYWWIISGVIVISGAAGTILPLKGILTDLAKYLSTLPIP